MKKEIKLENPILINGKSHSVLAYDPQEITAIHFAEAESRKLTATSSKTGNRSGAVELDYGFHLYLGFAAIVAVNPDIDMSDLERLKGKDVLEVMKIGRNFIISRSEEPSEAGNSEESSETTLESSQSRSLTSNERD